MNKKAAKEQYMRMQLADPNVSEFEKEQIRQRLGIVIFVAESDFTNKHGDELFEFVFRYLNNHLTRIRQQKRTNSPFDFLSENLKAMYHLSTYANVFEDDCLAYMLDESKNDYKLLSKSFEMIGKKNEATLINSMLTKRVITNEEIEKLQEHFWDSNTIVHELNMTIEKFIVSNITELIELQKK